MDDLKKKEIVIPDCYGESWGSECDIDCPFAQDCKFDTENPEPFEDENDFL